MSNITSMAQSTDPNHFFQTDASESTRARRALKASNKKGDPIILQSKILSAIPDPFSTTCIYVAESAGCVRKVDVKTKDSKTVFRGPSAPLTSVAVGGPNGNTLFAGCWDKEIWSWDVDSKAVKLRYKGHTDFVKTVLCATIGNKNYLISGGADCKIMVWDIETGVRLHTLRDKLDTMMAVQDLALDPVDSTESEIVVVSASSDPHIRRWRISLTAASQILDPAEEASASSKAARSTILEHETSVYKVSFNMDDEEADLWTASADGTAKCLSRAKHWSTEETYEHGDYVRAVVVSDGLVVTAGRDEDVKVWDHASGKLRHVYDGHYQEVTGLVALEGRKVASVSIDGTVRTWGVGEADLEKAIREREAEVKGLIKEEKVKESLLSAEEEAELAELMDEE